MKGYVGQNTVPKFRLFINYLASAPANKQTFPKKSVCLRIINVQIDALCLDRYWFFLFLFMSYETKIEELVRHFYDEYQEELLLAIEIENYLNKTAVIHDYPEQAYHPQNILKPLQRRFIAKTGGRLSNHVPRVLSAKIIGDYPLGVYFPR